MRITTHSDRTFGVRIEPGHRVLTTAVRNWTHPTRSPRHRIVDDVEDWMLSLHPTIRHYWDYTDSIYVIEFPAYEDAMHFLLRWS